MITYYTTNVTWTLRLIVLSSALLAAVSLPAYESYHNPATQDQGYCAQCHPGFVGGQDSPLHSVHTEPSDPVTTDCTLCHTGSGRNNPLIMWSNQGNGLGCMGCHGLDYGETIKTNYNGFTTMGQHKNSGYGLRRHHARSGVTVCATCHTNDVNVAPYGENVVNTGLGFTTNYYNLASVSLNGKPVNPCNNEDSTNDADTKGLDNDGDGLYDGADPDCTGAPVSLKLLNTTTNTTVLSWPYTFDGWHVQSSSNIASIGWTDLAAVPRENTNGFWQVILSPASGPRYYRLSKKVL
jgi:hypothetical protein